MWEWQGAAVSEVERRDHSNSSEDWRGTPPPQPADPCPPPPSLGCKCLRWRVTCEQVVLIPGRHIFYQEKLWKIFKRAQKTFLMYCFWLSAPFIAFELFCDSVIGGKQIVMQMIFAHRNANEFCPVGCCWLLHSGYWLVFAFIYKLLSAFQLALIGILFECSFDLVVTLYWFSY